jgi:membrane protease YdiL (CAAX protease family)
MNWTSIAVAALIFGVLHIGNGRNYSFAIWCMSLISENWIVDLNSFYRILSMAHPFFIVVLLT